jgi:hypothetical protein
METVLAIELVLVELFHTKGLGWEDERGMAALAVALQGQARLGAIESMD